jgi:PAS domain S-box-containing protein
MPTREIRILLVEDSASHAEMICDALREGGHRYSLTVVDSLRAARERMAESPPDMAIVDLFLPDGKGTDLLPESPEEATLPVIVMTGQGDEQLAVSAMKCGALDYVVKSADALAKLQHIVERAWREWGHIVERRQAEKAMRRSEAKFRSIFESAASGVAFLTPEGQVLQANPVFCRVSGYSPAEIARLNVLDVTHPDFQEQTRQVYRKIASGSQKVVAYEKAYLTKAGAKVWGHVTLARVHDSDSEIPYVVAIVNDITERKRAEDHLREANEELDAFVSTVAHDLRTPLTPIIGYSEFVAENYRDVLDRQALASLEQIRAQGRRMLAIMEDLLALSRVRAVDMPSQPVNTAAVVEQVLNDLAVPLREKGATVDVGSLPSVVMPESLLTQVLSNLIGNALNYGCPAGGTIEVDGERQGRMVRFRVRDHGPGIAEADRERVFDIFFRGRESSGSTGSGLGLAIVRKIAHYFDGRAWCEHTPGGGATLWVEFELPESRAAC